MGAACGAVLVNNYFEAVSASIFSITIAFDPPRSNTFPEAVTIWPAKGSSFSFCPVEGVASEMGQYTVPSFVKITSGDPAFAQAFAHCGLIGFSSFLVNAQAESSK